MNKVLNESIFEYKVVLNNILYGDSIRIHNFCKQRLLKWRERNKF